MRKITGARFRSPKLIVLLAFLFGCDSPIIIDGFSDKKWRSDRNGCFQIREMEIDALMMGKSSILRQSENKILAFLGKPDKNELYTRNQKFFIYYISPNSGCKMYSISEQLTYLSVRINAVGVATEAFVYKNGNE